MRLHKMGKTFLTGLSLLLLSSCVGFPQLHPYLLSIKNGQCAQYKAIGQETACSAQFVFVQWLPLSACDGFYAIPATDVAALRNYQVQQCSSK